jgi:hypothetical protein
MREVNLECYLFESLNIELYIYKFIQIRKIIGSFTCSCIFINKDRYETKNTLHL